MARNYYSEINLHMTWHTKESAPLLTPKVEAFVHHYIRGRLMNTPGAFFHDIGGTENHVHVVVTIAPTILISDMIGKLKGSSSHEANQKLGVVNKVLQWQDGYGVLSFGTKDLPWVIDYVRRQKEHHAKGTTVDRLERITTPDEAKAEPRETP